MSHRGYGLACAVLVALAAGGAVPATRRGGEDEALAHGSRPTGGSTATIRFHGPESPLRAVVRRRGEPVLTTTIGLATATRCLPMGFTPEGRRAARRRSSATAPRAGKRRVHRLLTHRLELTFEQGGSELVVELRASDDGFAYRTSLTGPARTPRDRRVQRVHRARRARPGCSASTAPTRRPTRRRCCATRCPGPIAYPALLRTGAAWTLLSESDVGTGQPATRLEVRPGHPRRAVRRAAARAARPAARAHALARRGDRPARHDRRVRPGRRPRPARPARRLVVGQARPRRLVVVVGQREPGAASTRQKAYVDFAAPHGLGVRARRRGLGPGVDAAARRVRPRAPREGDACGRAGTRSRCRPSATRCSRSGGAGASRA